jgi:hypothetical protein
VRHRRARGGGFSCRSSPIPVESVCLLPAVRGASGLAADRQGPGSCQQCRGSHTGKGSACPS